MKELKKHESFLRIEDMAENTLAIFIGPTPPPVYEQTRVEHVLLGGEVLIQAIGKPRKRRNGEILALESDLETISRAHASGELLKLVFGETSAPVLIHRIDQARYAAPDEDGRLFAARVELVQIEE